MIGTSVMKVLIAMQVKLNYFMNVCSCHVTYAFQSESALYSCLNVKELFTRSRREIRSLSDCNWTGTQNHLGLKRTLNHLASLACLAKWLSVRLRIKWFWVPVRLQSLKPPHVFESVRVILWVTETTSFCFR